MSYNIVQKYLTDEIKYDPQEEKYNFAPGSIGSLIACLPPLYDLVVKSESKNVVELGTDTGSSTIALLAACRQMGGKLHSIDIVDCPVATEKVRKYGLDDIWTFTCMDDLEMSRVWTSGPIDFLFIDTSHSYQHTKDELDLWIPLVRNGGYIVFHDVISRKDEIQKAIDEYMESHKDRITSYRIVVGGSYGLGLMIKE